MKTIDTFTGTCRHHFEVLAGNLRPYAFTYPIIEAGLGIAAFTLSALTYFRTHARN